MALALALAVAISACGAIGLVSQSGSTPTYTQATPTATATPNSPPTATPTITPSSTPSRTPTATATPTASARADLGLAVDPTRLDIVDQHALAATSDDAASIKALAEYLASVTKDDVEKTRAIYRWITENITYDVPAFLTGRYGDQSAEGVLATRKGVCAGYANLFQALGKAMGLEVGIIGGWAKGYSFDLGDLDQETNHAWNAVRIEDRWYLVESTWGSGYIDENQRFIRRFTGYYFLTPPEQLIYTHFPEDARWQLLDVQMSREKFASLPEVKTAFFEYGLELGSHTRGMIDVVQEVSITLGAPSGVLLMAAVEQVGQRLADTYTFVQRNGAEYQVDAVFPGPGEYDLIVFAKLQDDPGMYSGALRYRVSVSHGAPVRAGFPQVYQGFGERGAYLYGPMEGYLPAGSTQTFKLSVPGAQRVALIMGQEWHQLNKNGDVFQGDVTVRQGEVQVCANFADGSKYSCLLSYTGY